VNGCRATRAAFCLISVDARICLRRRICEHSRRVSVSHHCSHLPRMGLQIENTLLSLLPPYQREITIAEYEIILIDNGSAQPLEQRLQELSPNLRYIYISPEEASPNPAAAPQHGSWSRACTTVVSDDRRCPNAHAHGVELGVAANEPRFRARRRVRGWHLGPKWQPERRHGRIRSGDGSATPGWKCAGKRTAIGFGK
jgi:hypothetical protein